MLTKISTGRDEHNRSWTLYESSRASYRVYLDGKRHRWGALSREGIFHDKKTWQGSVHLCDRYERQLKANRVRDFNGYRTRQELINDIVYALDIMR